MNIIKNENYNLKIQINNIYNDIDIIKNENIKLNNEINTLKLNNNSYNLKTETPDDNDIRQKIQEQNNKLNYLIKNFIYIGKSVMMNYDEIDMIFSEIQKMMKRNIREIKKLYQATIDGGESKVFHKKCDDIPNTLILIKSQGYRRFGGFKPIPWKTKGNWL